MASPFLMITTIGEANGEVDGRMISAGLIFWLDRQVSRTLEANGWTLCIIGLSTPISLSQTNYAL